MGREWSIGLPMVLAAIAAGTLERFKFGVLDAPWAYLLGADFGVPLSEIAQVSSFMVLVTLILSPLVGVLADRFGAQLIALIGITAFSLAFFTATITGNITFSYMISIIATGFAVAFSGCVILMPICRIFTKSRGMAIGIALAGASVGYLIALGLSASMLETSNWRETVSVLIPGLGLVAFLSFALLCPSPARLQSLIATNQCMTPQLNFLQFLALLCAFAAVTFLSANLSASHFFPESGAVGQLVAVRTITVLLGCGGMLLAGFVEDRWGGNWPIMVGYGLALLAFILSFLTRDTDVPAPIAFFAAGMVTVSTILRCSRMVPAQHYGLTLGIMQSFGAGGALVGLFIVLSGY